MRVAQRLYEGVEIGGETVGLITYMRTDGVDIGPPAVQEIRRVIGREYGEQLRPGRAAQIPVKAKNAQEAHEAIRPTDIGRLPKHVAQVPRTRAGAALRTDLDPHHREPDGIGRARAHHRRHRCAAVGPRKLDLRATGQVDQVRRLPDAL